MCFQLLTFGKILFVFVVRFAASDNSLVISCAGKLTCAIGDGGNDVSMIQASDAGVGIVGKVTVVPR